MMVAMPYIYCWYSSVICLLNIIYISYKLYQLNAFNIPQAFWNKTHVQGELTVWFQINWPPAISEKTAWKMAFSGDFEFDWIEVQLQNQRFSHPYHFIYEIFFLCFFHKLILKLVHSSMFINIVKCECITLIGSNDTAVTKPIFDLKTDCKFKSHRFSLWFKFWFCNWLCSSVIAIIYPDGGGVRGIEISKSPGEKRPNSDQSSFCREMTWILVSWCSIERYNGSTNGWQMAVL